MRAPHRHTSDCARRRRAAACAAAAAAAIVLAHPPASADDNPSYERGPGVGLRPEKPRDIPGLPAFPRTENLRKLDAEEIGSSYEYWVDEESVSVDDDGIVRYTLVMRSSRGAANIVFEGFRCDAQSYKTYAYGTREGTFQSYSETGWRRIAMDADSRSRAYLWLLYNRYFCSFDGQRYDLRDIRKLLRGESTVTNEGWRSPWNK